MALYQMKTLISIFLISFITQTLYLIITGYFSFFEIFLKGEFLNFQFSISFIHSIHLGWQEYTFLGGTIKPIVSFATLLTIKYDIFSTSSIFNGIIFLTVFTNLALVFAQSPTQYPRFFVILKSTFVNMPMIVMYYGRGKYIRETVIISISLSIYYFYTSLGQTMTLNFTYETYHVFLFEFIFNQMSPVIYFYFFQSEILAYSSLLEKHLKFIENKSESKTVFISRMSHELRTPVHGLLSSVTLLKQTKINDEQSAYISTIDSCGELILDIITQILDIVRIESGKFDSRKEKFSLCELVQHISDSVSSLANVKNLEQFIYFQPDPQGYDVEGDQLHLKEIFVNVIFLFLFPFFFSFFFSLFCFLFSFYLFISFSFFFLFFFLFLFLFFFLIFKVSSSKKKKKDTWKCIKIYRNWKYYNQYF